MIIFCVCVIVNILWIIININLIIAWQKCWTVRVSYIHNCWAMFDQVWFITIARQCVVDVDE